MCDEPIAVVTVDRTDVIADPRALITTAAGAVAQAEARHCHQALGGSPLCHWRQEMARVAADPEPISIVICTTGRPERLRATLESLQAVDYPVFELVLVDNAPTDEANRDVLAELGDTVEARYVEAPIRGLSRARNVGLRSARYDIIAYTDDDVLLNRRWLHSVLYALRSDPSVGVVTGPVLPAEIATPAQAAFERQGGLTKGRGFTRAILSQRSQSPYFPLPPFAVGCNMTFRRQLLEAVGAFDEALGAGTPAGAGEDTAVVAEAMLSGSSVAFEPGAVMWHYHRRTESDLTTQRSNYGIGLGAFYTSLVLRDKARLWPLVKLAPQAVGALTGRTSRTGNPTASYDRKSSVVVRRQILRGPLAYLRGRRHSSRLN